MWKIPTEVTVIPAKGTFCQQAKISTKQKWIWKKTSLETIKISVTVIALTSENLFRDDDLSYHLKVDNFSQNFQKHIKACLIA